MWNNVQIASNHLIYLILGLLFCNFSQAQQPKLKVLTEHAPPYQIETPTGVLGPAPEIVTGALALINHHEPHWVYPWARAYKTATTRKNVLLYSVRRTKSREHQFYWIGPIFKQGSVLRQEGNLIIWQRLNDPTIIHSLADAKQNTIVVVRKDYVADIVTKELHWPKQNIVITRDWKAAVTAFFRGRSKLLAMQQQHLPTFIKQLHFSDIKVKAAVDLGLMPLHYLVLSKVSEPALAEQLHQALITFHQSQDYLFIEQKWQHFFNHNPL